MVTMVIYKGQTIFYLLLVSWIREEINRCHMVTITFINMLPWLWNMYMYIHSRHQFVNHSIRCLLEHNTQASSLTMVTDLPWLKTGYQFVVQYDCQSNMYSLLSLHYGYHYK